MPRDRGDPALLHDMLQAAQAVSRYLAGKVHEDFFRDEILRAAVERKLEIIGEAARKVSRGFQTANHHVPWQKIAATRHVLAHDYGEVNDEIVWRIATVYVPELIEMLLPLVPAPPPDPEPGE
jgi:uncharacterized protein with HEPN domain